MIRAPALRAARRADRCGCPAQLGSATPERGFCVTPKMKPKFSCQVTLCESAAPMRGRLPLPCEASLRILPRPPCRTGRASPSQPSARPAELGLRLSHSGRRRRLSESVAAAVLALSHVWQAAHSWHMHECSREWWRRQRGGARAVRGRRGLRGLPAALRSQV